MEEKKEVTFEVKEGVMTITIDNPDTKNGLDWIGINQLADCYQYAMEHDDIMVMIITGNKQYFYTGGRVNQSSGESQKYADAIERLTTLQDKNTTPIIAAVSGHCLKAGMGIVAGADFAVAREGVEFGFPEIRMGGVPMMVMAETIDSMPKKFALEAYYSSWNFSAQKAYDMGLLNAVTTDEDFWPTVEKYVHIFKNTPSNLISMTRKAYEELSRTPERSERRKIAMKMLRENVLTAMEKGKTTYNV